MSFPNTHFYGGELKAADKVKNHKLEPSVFKESSDEFIENICDFKKGITFVDTKGNFRENTPKGSTSKENSEEAKIVKNIVDRILDKGINPENIGIISPYDAQIDLLKNKINFSGLEIKTVDGFQGREKDAIILSLVRSNQNGDIGFLTDLRRLNVSLTRARKKLIIIGDGDTLGTDRTYNELMNYIAENGNYLNISI
jgi:superfamily I DNA and/or RNA helicase